MLKPLLRTIPTLSGNVKLACAVTDYQQIDEVSYEAYIRAASLLPLSSILHQNLMPISLLQSNYEQDLKKFYGAYSNYFYDTCFTYIKDDYQKLDKYNVNKRRNVDFEMGCKRLSYQKLNYQFAFFAPIFIESSNDLPDYFLLKVAIKNNFFSTERQIKINIVNNGEDSLNYLYRYLYKYSSKIDSNYIYCLENTKQATYYGIDLLSGTFVRKIDNEINPIYKEHLTINKFDSLLSNGWKRNKMCMKQIMPLAFYFNVNDFLTDNEKINFKNATIYVSGSYYKDGIECPFYDFDTNYTNLYVPSLRMNQQTGIMEYVQTNRDIMRSLDPGLAEGLFYKYRNTNKLNLLYNRWKLKYSNEEHPYFTNMSFAFSWNQYSSYKYGGYPETFMPLSGISNVDNNFLAPIGSLITNNQSPYYKKDILINSYKSIMNKFVTTWYNGIKGTEVFYSIILKNKSEIDTTITYYYFDKQKYEYIAYETSKLVEEIGLHKNGIWVYYKKNIFNNYYWSNVKDNKAYFGGILYDFNQIWNKINKDGKEFDKFGVFVQFEFTPIQSNNIVGLKNAKYILQSTNDKTFNKNCTLSQDVNYPSMQSTFGEPTSFDEIRKIFSNESSTTIDANEVGTDQLFIKDTTGDPEYIDLAEYGFFYHDMNTYFSINEIYKVLYNKFNYNLSLVFKTTSIIEGYELLPIYYLDSLFRKNYYSDNITFIFDDFIQKYSDLTDNLYLSNKDNSNKTKYNSTTVKKLYGFTKRFDNPVYIKKKFISIADLYKDIISYTLGLNKKAMSKKDIENETANIKNKLNEVIPELTHFEYYPVYSVYSKIIARNTFVRNIQWIDSHYGNIITNQLVEKDKDVIFMDQYNINNIVSVINSGEIATYNKTAKEEDKLSYYSYYKTEDENITNVTSYTKYITLTNANSQDLYAKFLNTEHFHFYINKLYKDRNGEFKNGKIENTLFIRKRVLMLNDIASNGKTYDNDINLKDNYIPITVFYDKDMDSRTMFTNIINDFIFTNGSWKFSDSLIKRFERGQVQEDKEFSTLNELYNLLEIDVNYNLKTIRFDFVFLKKFIQLNDELYHLANIDKLYENEYKDLYLYYIEHPYDFLTYQSIYTYPPVHKNYNYANAYYTAYDLSYCLKPLFNDVRVQKREDAVIYKEYEQSKLSKATYSYVLADGSRGYANYYRYRADDMHCMINIKEYNNSYLYGKDPYTNEGSYYYKKSYVNSYFENSGYDLLDYSIPANVHNKEMKGYNIISKASAVLEKAITYYPHAENKLSYSYTDTSESNKHIGYHVSYSYYSVARFNKLYPENKRSYISYTINNGVASVGETTTYTYYPTYNVYDRVITYTMKEYDDLQLYDNFKLNSYISTYSYTYTHNNVECTGYNSITYAFYLIKAKIDNTKASFNIVDTDMESKKYFTKINGINIYDPNYSKIDFTSTFDMFIPFSKLNILKSMVNIDTIIKPKLYNINVSYSQQISIDENNSYLYDIVNSAKHQNIFNAERYFDSLEPCLNKKYNLIVNMLKFKTINETTKLTYTNNNIYNSEINIYNYEPIKLFNPSNNKEYDEFTEYEYKWFNANKYHNLEEELSNIVGTSLTEENINEAKKESNIIKAFKTCIESDGKNEFSNDEILFLYNRYTVSFDIISTGIDTLGKEKLYKFTYKFKLI